MHMMASSLGSCTIPAVNLRRSREGDGARREVAAQLVKALEEVGFIYLDGVDGLDPQLLRRSTEWFFSLPAREKLAVTKNHWNPESPNVYRGFFPAQGAVSHKESLEIGIDSLSPSDPDVQKFMLYEPNLWPNENGGIDFEAFPHFRANLVQYFEQMSLTGLEIIRLIARGMGLDEHFFDELFLEKSLSTLRLLHYPPRKDPPPPEALDGDTLLQCEAHCDSTAVTMLYTFEFGGLQVLTQDGKWLEVAPRPNSLVMNIGDLLSRMTGGRLKATIHRVRVVDSSKSRFSVPFFYEPSYRANIGKFLPVEESKVDAKEVQHYGPWLIHTMKVVKKYVEYKDVDFGDYLDF